ncbi:MAG: hypothetical protein K5930_01785 [Treponemataceae bacterium]|nr:hypothetical protein [Treponemataceae bacterium]
MASVTNYKCPACTGPVHFSEKTGQLVCDFCGSSYTVEQMDEIYGKKVEEQAKQEPEPQPADVVDSGMKAFNCPSCGAQLFCDSTTVATSCPYCGNPTVIPCQFKEKRMPDYVLPFRLDKNAAKQALKDHYKGKRFLPTAFSDENHIDEIKGVYVPFWLFDGKVDADVTFDASSSTVRTTGKKEITTTKHYRLKRKGAVSFTRIPEDASEKMDDAQMDSIEPFDFDELKEYSSSYLPGFLAESFDVEEDACLDRVQNRIEPTVINMMEKDINVYDTLTVASKQINFTKTGCKYAFIPVWLLSTKWKDKNFLFAMNGQTGKFVGDLPIDKGKYWRLFSIITITVTAVSTAVMFFL